MSYTFIPTYIREVQSELPRAKISAEHWNNLFNRLIIQGDANSEALHELINLRSIAAGPKIFNAVGTAQADVTEIQFLNTTMFLEDGRLYISGVQGPIGPEGPVGPLGPEGPQGETGNSFVIRGMFATLLDLTTAYPVGQEGQAFFVGNNTTNTVYLWDVEEEEWVDVGPIQGPAGAAGAAGPEGPAGPAGPEGPPGDTSALTAHTGDLNIHVTIGDKATWNAKSNLAIGELETQAYRGDRGKIAYDHSQTTHAVVPTGAITTVISSDLTASRVAVLNTLGKFAASTITTTQLGYLTDVTANIQNQLNGKLGTSAQAADSLKWEGRRIYVGATEPAGAVNGDIWLKPAA